MNEPLLDLLGDPLPEPLPEKIQLTEIESLVGHTIRAAIDDPNGRRGCDFLLVTDMLCWMAFEAEGDCHGDDYAECKIIKRKHSSSPEQWLLNDFAGPFELFESGVITESEYTVMKAIEADRRKKENAERAARLRADADRLEKGL